MSLVEEVQREQKRLRFPRNRLEVAEYEQGQQLAEKLIDGYEVDNAQEVARVLAELRAAGQGVSVSRVIRRREGSTLRVSKAPQRLPDSWQGIGNNVYGVLVVASPVWLMTSWMIWELLGQR